MADPYYSVLIQLGDPALGDLQSWTITHTGDPTAADDMTPIAGLRFGWAMPDNVLWPLQPSPMTAAFAVNLPQFADLSWVGEDTPVAIEVKLHASGPVAFAFYGRVTDATATPRRGRTGVTLGCTCVDYTIDLTRGRYASGDLSSITDDAAVELAFLDNPDLLGAVPPWPLANVILGAGSPINIPNATTLSYDAIILPILAQAYEEGLTVGGGIGGPSDTGMLILAPNIDPATRLLDATQKFTYEILYRHPYTSHTIPAALLDRSSATWYRNKRTVVDSIYVHTVSLGAAFATNGGGILGVNIGALAEYRTVSDYVDRAQIIADFYLEDAAADRRGWNLQSVRYLLDQVDPADFESTFPDDLMPRWTDTPEEYSRASCYGTLIDLDGVLDHTNPYGTTADTTLRGLLSSAEFTLAGGRPSLTLGFREMVYDAPTTLAAFITSGYAMNPYSGLATAPA